MKILTTIIYVILIFLYFANLIINHENYFIFYLGVIVIISAFFTIFRFMELNNSYKIIPKNVQFAFKIINYLSYLSILISIILYVSVNNLDHKYSIIFYIYSLNLLMFIFISFKNKYL